jgi:hypothetical protein
VPLRIDSMEFVSISDTHHTNKFLCRIYKLLSVVYIRLEKASEVIGFGACTMYGLDYYIWRLF